jgi:ZIP family zinc transporter
MATSTTPPPTPPTAPASHGTSRGRAFALFLVPVLALAAVIALFLVTNGAGLNVTPVAPAESVQFGQTTLRPGVIELHLQNTSPQPITIAQVSVNDAVWPYAISPDPTLARLDTATITLEYPWVTGEAYEVAVFSSSGVAFHTSIPVAASTATVTAGTLWSFTAIGVYVGIIPVLLGMCWLPALRRLGPRAMVFLLAATVGLLLYLGVEATGEALESAAELGGAFQGTGLVAIGIVGTWLLLDAVNRRRAGVGHGAAEQHMALATMIALGIGLHNLGEGLAIGAAYSVGAATLGTFLVIGFILQNLTEGLGIVAPLAKDKPSLSSLALLGLLGGGPAIVGAWIGGLLSSRPLSVLFLAIGAGAVFQVAYEIGKRLLWTETAQQKMPLTVFAGILLGMLLLYGTGIVIK